MIFLCKYYYKEYNIIIESLYISLINVIIISLLLIRLINAHIYYIKTNNIVNKLHVSLIDILSYCFISFENDADDELSINYLNDYNNNFDNINNNKLIINSYYNDQRINNPQSNNNKDIYNKETYKEIVVIKELLLLYITYLFQICKNKNKNFQDLNNIKLKDIDYFEKIINIKIYKLYFNFNINNEQFKLNYLETEIYRILHKSYNTGMLNGYSYKYILKSILIIKSNSSKLLYQLDNNVIIFKLLHYLNELLILINVFSLSIYYNNELPNEGIIFVLIILFIYLYLNQLVYILLNVFRYIDNDNQKNYGINLDNILHNIYDEVYIISNLQTSYLDTNSNIDFLI